MRRVAVISLMLACSGLSLACERGPAPTPPPDPVAADVDATDDAEPDPNTTDPGTPAPAADEPTSEEPSEDPSADASPSAGEVAAEDTGKVADANLRVGSATVDGLTVNELECRVEGGGMGLLGNLAVIGALAKRKSEIAKCGKPGSAAEVRWTASGGKITKAEGQASEGECVAKQLRGLATPANGECAAMIVI